MLVNGQLLFNYGLQILLMRLLEMSEITGTQRTAKMKAKITFFEHTIVS